MYPYSSYSILKVCMVKLWKVRTIWPMDLVFMSTFDNQSMSIGAPLWFSLTLPLKSIGKNWRIPKLELAGRTEGSPSPLCQAS